MLTFIRKEQNSTTENGEYVQEAKSGWIRTQYTDAVKTQTDGVCTNFRHKCKHENMKGKCRGFAWFKTGSAFTMKEMCYRELLKKT